MTAAESSMEPRSYRTIDGAESFQPQVVRQQRASCRNFVGRQSLDPRLVVHDIDRKPHQARRSVEGLGRGNTELGAGDGRRQVYRSRPENAPKQPRQLRSAAGKGEVPGRAIRDPTSIDAVGYPTDAFLPQGL